MTAIKTENLRKEYKDLVAVDSLNLSVEQGELFSLLGVNGAGKTTTIKMLTCLTRPTSGNAFLNGKSILTDIVAVKQMIAVSPQETAIAPKLTVRENLKLMCGVYGLSKEKKERRTDELLKSFEMENIADKKAEKLSGGWQRRLSIAMALISEPQILFLDEPTLGLDVLARSELWDVISSLKGKITIILTTHYLQEAQALSDRVGIMKNGSLIACDTVNNIINFANADSFEQAFISIARGENK